ncbi:conserved Plasmodium protein, unknown function [Plasmodium berghei]|uniref:Uncharacterized protein n=2 Tax=Plasmodium berghei TaxID=5821 RepID=A0A509AP81_PLABA|nr:conserved Plasmodium protein, unknown function [Plasmodium berghei ANKA]CXI89452.1 conserved Plasmodium protein, unknown function [Plasmodium berghei]SCL96069.1 conserved Plasmodium protein, unknown function [Plasmodium berghei]SCM16355.1 conserved Plasmodium protein, unknown function [Plasmodium berghei]SCM18149.1 conserved Plasmodium protein, unknown function [Plasmodium berghei]SCN27576.1 conserved Plasmodium protein, unknown function [Plasmodium berghei]|eukprot:XP_034423232.1 conserved Plasmodium protein, unknown function [Plasmodium berghei ANKA]
MQKFIDKIKLQNLQEQNPKNQILISKKICFNNILGKKKIEEEKLENNKLLKDVESYYNYTLKRKVFFVVLHEYYRKQSIFLLLKFNEMQRKRERVFRLLLTNKYNRKITKCVISSISIFNGVSQRMNLKFSIFKIIKNKFFNTKKVCLKIMKRKIHRIKMKIFYGWENLTKKIISNKIEEAYTYHILRQKKRIFFLWKRLINDEKLFKNIDSIFRALEAIASSWLKN